MQIEEEKKHSLDPEFWSDPKRANTILKRIKDKEFWLKKYQTTADAVGDLEVLFEFYEMGDVTEEELENQYLISKEVVDHPRPSLYREEGLEG